MIASAIPEKFLRLLLTGIVAGLVSFTAATLAPAQSVRQPGELGIASQLRPASGLNPYSPGDGAGITVAHVEDAHDRMLNRLWIASILSAVAATSFDAASSWGLKEGNGLLASSSGQFRGRGLAIKGGLAAAALVPQICLRRHTDLRRAFILGNFVQTGIFSSVAIHNLRLKDR